MVLRGRLSNPEFQELVYSITNYKTGKVPAKKKKRRAPAKIPRRLGDIAQAIVAVLAEAEDEMRLRDIHVKVGERLGSQVSFYSVADYLSKRSKDKNPLFEHTRYAYYRLRR